MTVTHHQPGDLIARLITNLVTNPNPVQQARLTRMLAFALRT